MKPKLQEASDVSLLETQPGDKETGVWKRGAMSVTLAGRGELSFHAVPRVPVQAPEAGHSSVHSKSTLPNSYVPTLFV